jgi:hypothetical protein
MLEMQGECVDSGEYYVCNLSGGKHNALLTELRLPLITNLTKILDDSSASNRTLVNSNADDLGTLDVTFPDTDSFSNGAAIQEEAYSFLEELLPHLLSNRTRVRDVHSEGEGVGLHLVLFD